MKIKCYFKDIPSTDVKQTNYNIHFTFKYSLTVTQIRNFEPPSGACVNMSIPTTRPIVSEVDVKLIIGISSITIRITVAINGQQVIATVLIQPSSIDFSAGFGK